MCMSVCFTAWAKVELTMNESVEVYLGDSAQIPCQYSFTDANNEPSFVMIQWFVVSTAGPAVKLTPPVWNYPTEHGRSRAALLKTVI